MTLQERAVYHAAKTNRALGFFDSELHRAASDYFTMAQVSIDQRNIKAATYRYRQGMKYAQAAERK